MEPIDRRSALRLIGAAPLAAGLTAGTAEAQRARAGASQALRAAARGQAYKPKFFTAHEWATVGLLANLIIPKDERSGSATDAGVPEFMDFMLGDDPTLETPIRGGLAWLDHECVDRWGKTFLASGDAERTAVLDDIAWPKKARREHAAGVAFFNSFRDLTASGFWSSQMGVQDLKYLGNVMVAEWNGCPDEALKKLGVSY